MDSGRGDGSPGVDDRVVLDREAVQPARAGVAASTRGVESRRVRWYSWSVFSVAVAATGALVGTGSPVPSVLPVVLLGALVACSLNQLAFFPSEWSATAEAAVLVAAVVGFADSAEFFGPVLVAFLCGPLDIVHWRQRAFWRMAYNSGNRMIAALLAAGVFHAAYTGGTWIQFVLAAFAASVVFAVVDLAVFVGFEWLRGEQSVRAAVCEDLFIDCLTVPLGLFGALAGTVASDVGWWAGALVLAPVPFAPSLVLVHARRRVRHVAVWRALQRALPVVVVGVVVIGSLVPFSALPSIPILVGLVVIALLTGLELRVDARAPVSPMVSALVVAAVVGGGDAAFAGAVVVAVIATATAWVVRGHVWWAPVLAAGAAAASAIVFDARPSRAGALAAALVFEVVVVTRMRRIVWTTPLVCAAIALAYGWDAIGAPGAVVFGAGALAIAATAAAWGAPPWASRLLGRWSARHLTGSHRGMLSITAGLALGLAVAAVMSTPDRAVLVALAESAGAGVTAMAMVGVRQWRFAPRRRAADAILLLGCSLAILLGYPPVAATGDTWSVVILAGALAVSAAVAWPIARRVDETAPVLAAPDVVEGARAR
jgi:hypothetical protein